MVGVLLAVLALTVQGIVFLFAFLFKIGVNLNPLEWGNSPSQPAQKPDEEEEIINDWVQRHFFEETLIHGLPYDADEINDRARNLTHRENRELFEDLKQDLEYIYGGKILLWSHDNRYYQWTKSLIIAKYYHCLDPYCVRHNDSKNKSHSWKSGTFPIEIPGNGHAPDGWIKLRCLQRIEYYLNNAGKGDICKFVIHGDGLKVDFPETKSIAGLAPITTGDKATISGKITLSIRTDEYVGAPESPYSDYETDPEYEYVRREIERTGNPDLCKYLIEKRVFEHTEDYDMKNILTQKQIEANQQEVWHYIEGLQEAYKQKVEADKKESELHQKMLEERRKEERERNRVLYVITAIIALFYCLIAWGSSGY